MGLIIRLSMRRATIAAVIFLSSILFVDACVTIQPHPPKPGGGGGGGNGGGQGEGQDQTGDDDADAGSLILSQNESQDQNSIPLRKYRQPIRRKLGCKQLKKYEMRIFHACGHSKPG